MVTSKCRFVVFFILLITVLSYQGAYAAKEILVGATVSLEGRYQEPSKMIRLSYKLWEKQVNEAGGILGRPVRLILYDDKSDKSLVAHYYKKLILEDKVDLVLAPYGTTLTFEASAVTERHKMVLMASAASGEMIWDRGYKHVFGVYALAKRYFIGFLDLAARNGMKSVVIIHSKSLFTEDAAAGAKLWSKRLGLDVQLAQSYSDGLTELPRIVALLEKIKPDAVILCSYPPDGYLFLNELKGSSYKPKALAMSITPGFPDFAMKAGDMAEGVFGPSQWEPDERVPFPGTQDFIKAFARFAETSPSYHAGSAYAACQLLQESIAAHGEIDHKKIRDYIAALDTVTVIGRFKVGPTGRQIGHNPIVVQWQNGKKEIVYPSKMQTGQPRFGKSSPPMLRNKDGKKR